jgi:bacillithiol biosynthesis cysteine-adding enzyme BshC
MEPSCVRQNLIPGTTKLFSDYLYNFERVSKFLPAHFSDSDALRRAVQTLQYPEARREQLIRALRRQNGDSASLDLLAKEGTVAVVTGQQVGLFSGPAYTVYKALTAVRLASELTHLGVNAVPVFWLATEDHDLAEVDHAWVFNEAAVPSKVAASSAVANGGPVGEVVLPDVPLTALRQALGQLPHAEAVMERVAAAYTTGATLGSAFRAFVEDVLKGFGLLYLDPLAPDIRAIATPLLRQVIEAVPELVRDLQQRDHELEDAGYHSQVLVDRDSSLLFLLDRGKRVPVRLKNGNFSTKERSYAPSELQDLAQQISPNALLRPVIQDYLLPNVAYIGGPAEIAYLAQSSLLYDKLLGRMPVIFPRNGFTLLDTRASKLLDRFALHVHDLFCSQEEVKSRVASKLVPQNLCQQFDAFRLATSSSLADLQAKLTGFDPTLEKAARKSGAKILYQIGKLSRKTARETLRRDQRATESATYLTNLVYPHRHLQERFYSIVPFLAQHGLDLPQRLWGETQLACPDHMVRTV